MSYETRYPLRVARTAMVASANAIASLVGVEMLRRGGNAVDAAVAMAAAMAVVEPHSSHLGGDVFLQFWNTETKKAYALNGSGAAPQLAEAAAMGAAVPTHGIRAAAIPGAVDGWIAALQNWGTLPLAEIFEPAVTLAEDGYALSAAQAQRLQEHDALWREFPESAAALIPDHLRPGAALHQPDLARTLRQIAAGGAPAFYEGEFADRLLAYSKKEGGYFTKSDLAGHRSQISDPIRTTYRGVTVTEQPPVSQGHILLEMLNIAEGFDLAAMGAESAEAVHIMAEAKKLAFSDCLAYLGDTPNTPLETLLSKDYADRQRRRINLKAAAARYTPGRITPGQFGSDTTSLCVIDARGNAATLIQSLFHPFGCGVVAPGTGVLLNNRMTGFSLDPTNPNYLMPGKRTMHTLNTYMLFQNDRLWAVGGTPGGDAQVQTNFQVITQLIDFGRNPQEAVESPKWHVAPDGPGLTVEERLPLDVSYELRRLGHEIDAIGPWSGQCASQLIVLDPETGALLGGSDPRGEGLALGY